MSTLAYRPELDGLRSVAVYLVVAFHAGMVFLEGGFVGVDLFFVLSGFLVTGVLLRDVDTKGHIRLGAFYARRVRRLLPAAVVVVVVTAALQLLVTSLPNRVDMVDDGRAALLYYANWHFILEGRDYFAEDLAPSPFLHFWSLSIEEQFYIVYPLVLLLLVRVAKRPVRAMWTVLVAVMVASIALQVWIARDDVNLAYYGTHTRVYQLAAGAALMLLVRRLAQGGGGRRAEAPPSPLVRWATPVAVVGLLGIALTASRVIDASESNRGLLTTLFSVMAIFGLWQSPRGLASRVLALPVPRYLGQVSYGTYLWHWPVVLVLKQVLDARPLVLTLLTAAIATGLAALSYQMFEMPIRRAQWMHRFNWPVVGAALTASVLVFAFVVPTVLQADRRPALAAGQEESQVGSLTARLDRPVPKDLDLVAAKDDIGPAGRVCDAADPEGCKFVDGSGQKVLVIGDSIVSPLTYAFIDMAERHDFTLYLMRSNGCPWQVEQLQTNWTDEQRATCVERRTDFYEDVLPQIDPDVVVVAGLARNEGLWEKRLVSPTSPPGESHDEMLRRTTQKTIDLITEDLGKPLVIFKSSLGTDGFNLQGFDPLDCLAKAKTLADCAVYPPIERPIVDAVYDVADAESDDVATVDINPLICPGLPVCSPAIKGTIVWHDNNHLTASFATERSEQIYRLLTATGLVE